MCACTIYKKLLTQNAYVFLSCQKSVRIALIMSVCGCEAVAFTQTSVRIESNAARKY